MMIPGESKRGNDVMIIPGESERGNDVMMIPGESGRGNDVMMPCGATLYKCMCIYVMLCGVWIIVDVLET